jgi:peptide/nickel transport system substrate-binding protein
MMTDGTSLRIGRRGLLAGAAGLSALSLLPGRLRAEEAPKRGGLLRMGIGGGSTTDDFDLRKLND